MSSSSATETPPVAKKISKRCPYGKGKNSYYCKDCGGKGICKHGKQKQICRLCDDGGSALCAHGEQKRQCLECHPDKRKEHLKPLWRTAQFFKDQDKLRESIAASLARANW